MIYYDTDKMSLLIDDILEERRTAQKLYDKISSIKCLANLQYNLDRNLMMKIQHLIDKSEDLVNYYSKLSIALEKTSDEAIEMFLETSRLLSDCSNSTSQLLNQTFDIDYL